MSATLGQPSVIENVAGAGGTAGAARAAKAEPDGRTLLLHHLALAAGAGLYPNLPYDTLTAFEPIGLVNFNLFVLTSKKGIPVSSAEEAIEYIRANADKVSFQPRRSGFRVAIVQPFAPVGMASKLQKLHIVVPPPP